MLNLRRFESRTLGEFDYALVVIFPFSTSYFLSQILK